jgi:glucose/arabinose dehydrogenase
VRARRVLGVAALAAAVACAGCGVRANQRERLAKPKMQFNPTPEATELEQHVYSYREGSVGGYDAGGGGCGCN